MSDTDDCLVYIALALSAKKKRKRKRRLWMRDCLMKRQLMTHEHLLLELKQLPELSNVMGISTEIFEELLGLISPFIMKMDTVMREAIPADQRLFTALRFLATGNYFHKLERTLPMSPATMSKVVFETCEAITTVLSDYIKMPATSDEWFEVATGFCDRWQFPNCLAAVAAKHIAIKNPPTSYSCYFNAEKFFSVVLIAAVDANSEFLHVEVDVESRKNDDVVFARSEFGRACLEETHNVPKSPTLSGSVKNLPYVFIGDAAFHMRKNLMTPFELHPGMAEEKQIFNYRLQRALRSARNALGLLTSRFGIFQRAILIAPERVGTVIRACCYLHNFLMHRARQSYMPTGAIDEENLKLGTIQAGAWRERCKELVSLQLKHPTKSDSSAQHVRKLYCEYFNNEGQVPWQQQFLNPQLQRSNSE